MYENANFYFRYFGARTPDLYAKFKSQLLIEVKL